MQQYADTDQYEFVDCDCLATNGVMVSIPNGIWPVAELDTVIVIVNNTTSLHLNKPAFLGLELTGKARKLDLS